MEQINVCLSGGADGADLAFGEAAHKAGHKVRHFSFEGHKSKALKDDIVVLSKEQLEIADTYLKEANKTLRRSWPVKNPFVANLLRRNFYQIISSDAVYAVSTIENGIVSGGTAWAVTMFIDKHKGNLCLAYVFDQETNTWYKWYNKWVPITTPPTPTKVWTGIGTRKLNNNGKQAINNLFDPRFYQHAT